MSRLLGPLVCSMVTAAAIGTATAAKPEQIGWDCWHSANGQQKGAQVIRLVHEDGMITLLGAEFMEYRILENNEVGLVAVRSYAEEDSATKHLGIDVFVIDKKTLAFRKTNTFVDGAGADNTPRRGKCVVRPPDR
jgi:hypothetical protein